MQSIGHRDIFVLAAASLWYITYQLGLLVLLKFVFQHLSFFALRLPYIYLCRRVLLPFFDQSGFSQRATDLEYMLVQVMRYYFKQIRGTNVGQVFEEGMPFLVLNKMRQLREMSDGLGDVRIVEDKKMKGAWIRSQSSSTLFDIVVVYIPGGGLVCMYTEYLTILVVNLMKQGFLSPAVFVSEWRGSEPSKQLLTTYKHVESLSDCPIVVMSDSLGCALNVSLIREVGSSRIAVSVLISPTFNSSAKSRTEDYMTPSIIPEWANSVYAPSLAVPSRGVVVSYGTDEFNTNDTDKFVDDLRSLGINVTVDKQPYLVHNGSLVRFYAERLVDLREASLRTYAALISRMVSPNNTKPLREPSQIITSDDESL